MEIEQVMEEFQNLIREARVEHARNFIKKHSLRREKEISRELLSLGIVYGNIQIYDLSIFCFELSKDISRDVKIKREARRNLAVAYDHLGIFFTRVELFLQAEFMYKRAAYLEPNLPHIHNNYAILLRKLGRIQEAQQQYETALELEPEDHEVHHNYAILLIRMGNLQEAEKHLRESLKKIDYFPAQLTCSLVLLAKSEYIEAESLLLTLLKNHPEDPRVLGNLGIALFAQGNLTKSIEYFSNARDQFMKQGNIKYSKTVEGYLDWIQARQAWISDDLDKSSQLLKSASDKFCLPEFEEQSLVLSVLSLLLPFDKKLTVALQSRSLRSLRDSITKLYEETAFFQKDTQIPKLPDLKVLFSKFNCIGILYNGLHFQSYDFGELERAREIFDQYNFPEAVRSVESLKDFLQELQYYRNLEEIPPKEEEELLNMIQPLNKIDGMITKEISEKAQEKAQAFSSEEIMSSIKRIETKLEEMEDIQEKNHQLLMETRDLLIKRDVARAEYIFEISEPLILKALLPISQKLRFTVKIGTFSESDIENILRTFEMLNARGKNVVIKKLKKLSGIDKRLLERLKMT